MDLHEYLQWYEGSRVYVDQDYILRKICKVFGQIAFRRSSILEGMGKFMERIDIQGERCVEIGTYNGITAVVLSRYFKEVVSIDILPREVKHQIIDCLGIKNIRFIDVKNNDGKRDVINRLQFDFAYIDGDHLHDTYSDWELVKRCGRVMFHAIKPENKSVYALVKSFPENQVTTNGMFALWQCT